MTPVEAGAVADTTPPACGEDHALPTPSLSRRRRWGFVAMFVVVVLLAVGCFLGWRAWTTQAIRGVTVGWAGEPTCTGTTLRPNGHAIEWTRDMSCQVQVIVRNHGPATVHVTGAVLAFLGPESGLMVQAAHADDQVFGPAQRHDLDATLVLDQTIESGGSWSFPVRMVYRPNGCDAAGTLKVFHWPSVAVDARGREWQVGSSRSLVIHSSHQNPGCQ